MLYFRIIKPFRCDARLRVDDEERGSHRRSDKSTTPFTFVFTRVQTSNSDTACVSPFLELPAELRNKVYEYLASEEVALRLSAGRLILPPLGSVCKKIRAEMRGVYDHDLVSNATLRIEARVINFHFRSLFRWLDEHDHQIIPKEQALDATRTQDLCNLSTGAVSGFLAG